MMGDYLRDGKRHPIITKWHWGKARQILRVDAQHGWQMFPCWPSRLIEVGLAPEEVTVLDSERWSIAREMLDGPKCFTIAEFRRRLEMARLAAAEPIQAQERVEEPSTRHQFLSNLGLDLSE
jgi:hypothetical protein